MAYTDYQNLRQVEKDYGVSFDRKAIFKNVVDVQPSDHLLFDLEDAKEIAFTSEKAKSEFIITPILRDIRRKNRHAISLMSGVSVSIPKTKLKGVLDFLWVRVPMSVEVRSPIFCVVEAKNRTIEEGYAQCAAELIGAYRFNEADDNPMPFIYGCVTNASDWVILKLENSIITIDTERYAIANLPQLLGVLQTIVKQFI